LDPYGEPIAQAISSSSRAGARSDGLVSDPQSVSLRLGRNWGTRGTARTADGWSAEVVIPSRTLSFAVVSTLGIESRAVHPREAIDAAVVSPTLDSFLYDLSRAGRLTGMGELDRARSRIHPYGVGRTRQSLSGRRALLQGAVGGEVTWKITPQLVTVFTANTDFAETEWIRGKSI